MVERESAAGWKKPPPEDAVRVWVRRPGEPDDSDSNWTTWLQEADLPQWIEPLAIEEWLQPGEEPNWS